MIIIFYIKFLKLKIKINFSFNINHFIIYSRAYNIKDLYKIIIMLNFAKTKKVYHTALVIIPPKNLWDPI